MAKVLRLQKMPVASSMSFVVAGSAGSCDSCSCCGGTCQEN